ncbi:CubicO group peptidase (beta-lactamase class C family) [Crossiella equi]|uniref:CubicO group peptidase (Beta-lactamase class C family) n=1 Tax=Crossiella equi TaxID=130796 RepID=A0ABS5A6W1_9PSEU|nr:serine hydrolase domain-containing protein [Crossiella equi]MBP2471954.1 CubicO group peptidase (beta-lactamase class C family) [Crossiella equi]
MDSDSERGIDRRRLLGWGGLAAAGMAVGAPLLGGGTGQAAAGGNEHVPPATRPGGALDRYLGKLIAEGRLSGSVVLTHRGRTILSRSGGLANRGKGVRFHEGTAVNLGSAVKPFVAVAILQLAQQGKVRLQDTIDVHLKGFDPEVGEKVTLHNMLVGDSGLEHPEVSVDRVFHSKEEVLAFHETWTRQGKLRFPPGSGRDTTSGGLDIAAQVVRAVTGMTYWDYAHEHIFKRAGMTSSGYYTRTQWLTEDHIARSYMKLKDGTVVDVAANLDKGSPSEYRPGFNPARNFIDFASDGGFSSARDLARFGQAIEDGTLLDRPWAQLFTGPKAPHLRGKFGGPPPPYPAFGGYTLPIALQYGQWTYNRFGFNPGSGAGYTVFPDSGWVIALSCNDEDTPVLEIGEQAEKAIFGQG